MRCSSLNSKTLPSPAAVLPWRESPLWIAGCNARLPQRQGTGHGGDRRRVAGSAHPGPALHRQLRLPIAAGAIRAPCRVCQRSILTFSACAACRRSSTCGALNKSSRGQPLPETYYPHYSLHSRRSCMQANRAVGVKWPCVLVLHAEPGADCAAARRSPAGEPQLTHVTFPPTWFLRCMLVLHAMPNRAPLFIKDGAVVVGQVSVTFKSS